MVRQSFSSMFKNLEKWIGDGSRLGPFVSKNGPRGVSASRIHAWVKAVSDELHEAVNNYEGIITI